MMFCIDFAADAAGLQTLTPEEVQRLVKVWVGRCRMGAILSWTLVIGWIVTAQVLRRDSVLPAKWYMLNADDASLTGW
jgi:hypothetical protein